MHKNKGSKARNPVVRWLIAMPKRGKIKHVAARPNNVRTTRKGAKDNAKLGS